MKYFYDPVAQLVCAFEADGTQDFLIKDYYAPLTAEEAHALINPVKSKEQLALERQAAIKMRLQEIDAESIRPLRALLTAPSSEVDLKKIADLDYEAGELRVELASLFPVEVPAEEAPPAE